MTTGNLSSSTSNGPKSVVNSEDLTPASQMAISVCRHQLHSLVPIYHQNPDPIHRHLNELKNYLRRRTYLSCIELHYVCNVIFHELGYEPTHKRHIKNLTYYRKFVNPFPFRIHHVAWLLFKDHDITLENPYYEPEDN